MASSGKLRTRWAAIGAACAVTLGGSTIGIVQASVSSGDRAVYVPITPVRVLDTRAGTPITNTTLKVVVEGSINLPSGSTEVVVPVDASAVALNFTVTEGQKNGQYGFVTAFPCTSDTDTPPNASSLNFESNVDIANAMNVTTSANGSICLYVYGTADLIVDIAGYYIDHNHDDRYYTETEVDTALTSKADITSLMAPIVPSLPVTIDSTGSVGAHTSTAIGTNGNPIISYYDGTNNDLKVAACKNPTCAGATEVDRSTNVTIDSTGSVGLSTSITIGINGNPIISYTDATNGDLKVAACLNPTCTTSTNTTIDSTGDVGLDTSIAIGINGNPIISYYDDTNSDLKVAACNNPTCTGATEGDRSTNATIDSNGAVGSDTSITIGINGNPIISYLDATNGDLKIAVCNNPTCTGVTEADRSINTAIDGSADYLGQYTSITIGTNGNPTISYYDTTNGDLKVFSPWWITGGR